MVTVENKRIRLQDVAKEAKVSVATASMALSDCPDISEGTKQRIRNMSKKLGYQRPADKQLLRQHNEQKPKILRFGFMSVGTRLNDEILTDLLHELTMEAVSIGLRIEVSATDNISNHDALVKQTLAFGHELDGLILTGRVDDNLLSGIEMYHIPCIVVGNVLRTGNKFLQLGQILAADEIGMGRFAADSLIADGHKRIGFVAEILFPGLYIDNWLSGYLLAHNSTCITVDPKLVQIAGKAFVGGKPAAEAFVAMGGHAPTAYIIPDIRTASTFISTLTAHKINTDKNVVIISGTSSLAMKYHLENYPQITMDQKVMAVQVIERLFCIIKKPPLSPTRLLLPFTVRNFSEPCNIEAHSAPQ